MSNCDNDVKVVVKAIDAVEAWLELDETDHTNPSEIGKQLAGGLLVFKTERWLEEGGS
jgi:hypothetical protein